jgi:hypothetical protein
MAHSTPTALAAHTGLYLRLSAAGHNVALWRGDPTGLRGYANAIGFKRDCGCGWGDLCTGARNESGSTIGACGARS